MLTEIVGDNVPAAYEEALWAFHVRNLPVTYSERGDVMAMPGPVLLTIHTPEERLLFDPERNANPFFHAMEFIWMMAGRNDAKWISQFNKRFTEYGDPPRGIINGAYGHRWRDHFGRDQLFDVVALLRKSPNTRRAVLGMWDPSHDLDPHNDIPCNTHIYFRSVNDSLDMTVCNRSNDLIWGMLGANAVHMTMLHELIASAVHSKVGVYRVFTNNLHVYSTHFDLINSAIPGRKYDKYTHDPFLATMPLIQQAELIEDFLDDCCEFVGSANPVLHTEWMKTVALPMKEIYLSKTMNQEKVLEIKAPDWRHACYEWLVRNRWEKSKVASLTTEA